MYKARFLSSDFSFCPLCKGDDSGFEDFSVAGQKWDVTRVEKMSPVMTIFPFIDPMSFSFCRLEMGMTLATGRPRFRMIMPCGSRSSRIRKHFALNSVAVNAFSLTFMALLG